MLSSLALLFVLLAVVSESRTINWNNGGGTNEWFNIANWDCQCVPTTADDVVINLSVRSTVLIGGQNFPALARTLTIGGSSTSPQVLIITGALTVVSGGVLNTNGHILVESGQNTPFINNGTFTVYATSGFIFTTGTLAGTGTFVFPPKTLLNFSNPAAKTIATNVQVDGAAQTSSSTGSTIIIAKGGGLVINGVLKAQTSLTITIDPFATFGVVKGTFVFSGPTLNIQGSSSIFNWQVDSKSVVVLDHPITSSNLQLSGTIRLTGAPAIGRSFSSVTGNGIIISEGGTNTFGNVQSNEFHANAGTVTISSSGSINTFKLSGAEVRGDKLSVSSATLSSGTLSQGIALTVSSSLTLNGIIGLNGAGTKITAPQNSRTNIVGGSQLTMTDYTNFTSAALTQTGNLQIVGTNTSQIINTGTWTVNGSVSIYNLKSYEGTWKVNSGGSVALNSASLTTSLFHNNGKVVFTTSSLTTGSISGNGDFSGFPTAFYSREYISAGKFSMTDGQVKIDGGSIGTVSVAGGQFAVGGKVNIKSLYFSVGRIIGEGLQKSTIVAESFNISGTVVTLKDLQVSTSNLALTCGTSCQLLTDHAIISTH